MATWYYYNEQDEKIEVTGGQLKGLAKAGMITPDTIVETAEGKTAPARRVKGLTFIAAAQPETVTPETESPESAPPVETEIYGLSESKPPAEEKLPTTPVPEEKNPFAVSLPEEVNPFVVSVQEKIAPLTFALATDGNPFAAAMQVESDSFMSADSFTLPTHAPPSFVPMKQDFGVSDYLWIIFAGYLIDPNNKAKVENMTSEQKSMLFRWRMVVAISICALIALPFLYTRPLVLLVLLAVFALLFIFSHHIPTSKILSSNKQQFSPDPSPAAPSLPTPPVDEIKKMKELLDLGVITQEEFAAFKKKTLGI